MQRLKTIRGTAYDNSKSQDFTAAALKGLVRENPILESNIVTATIETTDTQVFHGLNRIPTGWIVINKIANCDVWQSTTDNGFPEKYFIMRSDTASVEITFLFF